MAGKKHQKGKNRQGSRRPPKALPSHRRPSPKEMLRTAIHHHQAGELQVAERLYRQVLARDAHNVIAIHHLGVIAYQAGNNEAATQLLSRALSLQPDCAEVRSNLGNVLMSQGNLRDAIICYRQAIAAKPDYVEAYTNLANALKEEGKLGEAVSCYQQAIRIKPDHAKAYAGLGATLNEQGKLDEAILSCRQALLLQDNLADAHGVLGNILKEHGDLEGALSAFQRALAIKPDFAVVHRLLASIHEYTAPNEQLLAMKNLFQNETASQNKMHLAFGLGKALEDLGEFQSAFRYLLEGNRLKRESFQYSMQEDQQLFHNIQRTVNSGAIANLTGSGCPDDTPIFILGMPRSGTSLVEQILASHPMVHGAGELDIFEKTFLGYTQTDSFVAAFEAVVHAQDTSALLGRIGKGYVEKLREFSATARFITDKMPHNFLAIGLIRLALPQARIIHCVRGPMDNCLSIFKNFFISEHKYAYDLRELGQYYILYQELMRHWHTLFPGAIYDIHYEDVIRAPEEETHKLLHHCGLPWDDACLSFHKTTRRVATASAAQVRKPIYNGSVKLWQKYERQMAPLKEILGGGSDFRFR